MADPKTPFLSAGGIVSPHPRRPHLPIFAAPTTADERNTVRLALRPVACMRLNDGHFDFDSSVVLPAAAKELSDLAPFALATPKPRPAVFGHADPVGNDAYNKELSGRRARAIYAVLTRDVASWEALAGTSFGGDQWAQRHLDMMLNALGFQGPFRVRDFQLAHPELNADGILGPKTRRVLFGAYMDLLCSDGAGSPYKYAPEELLGGGAAPDGRIAMQGCGELNPVLMLSSSEVAGFLPSKRNQENAPNRRVVVFLFPEDTVVSPDTWPCPSVKEDGTKCQARLWSDAAARRQPTASRRSYAGTRDTLACRFYERFAFHSPCELTEGPGGPGVVTFRIRRETDGAPAVGVLAVIRLPDGTTTEVLTDNAGEARLQGVKGETFQLLDVRDIDQGHVLGSMDKAGGANA